MLSSGDRTSITAAGTCSDETNIGIGQRAQTNVRNTVVLCAHLHTHVRQCFKLPGSFESFKPSQDGLYHPGMLQFSHAPLPQLAVDIFRIRTITRAEILFEAHFRGCHSPSRTQSYSG